MIKTVDRYIGKAAIFGILLVWVSLTALMMMFSLLSELRGTTATYLTSDVFWFVFQTSPRLAYQIFPVSALMGSLIGIGGLAGGNELVAFRTAGVSRLRLAAAGLAGALLLTIPVMVIGEWVGFNCFPLVRFGFWFPWQGNPRQPRRPSPKRGFVG